MAAGSPIEWLQRPGTKPASWNPIVAYRWVEQPDGSKKRLRGWHCEHVHGGCVGCYAEAQNESGARGGTKLPYKPGHRNDVEIELHEKTLLQPLKWRYPRMIFVCSMTDLYGAWVKDEWLDKIKAVQAMTPQHTYIELTKRPVRMRDYALKAQDRLVRSTAGGNQNISVLTGRSYHSTTHIGGAFTFPLPNVWSVVSCSEQKDADAFVPILLNTPAAVRGVSLEPLLGPIDLTQIDHSRPRLTDALRGRMGDRYDGPRLDWVIVGGESGGKKARPMHPDWVRSLRDQCDAASGGDRFFFKQWGAWVSVSEVEGKGDHFSFADGATVRRVGKLRAGRTLDGVEHNSFPAVSA